MIGYILPLLAYLAGSVSSAIIVCRIMGLPDPRSTGSNNPGATNVLRIGGKKAAAITLAGDFLKGLLPVLLSQQLTADPVILSLVGLGAFLGHLYPLYFGFTGGKGVATAAGVFVALGWQFMLILLAIWLLMALAFRYSSLAALTAAACAPVVAAFTLPHPAYIALCAAIALLLFWRHRENIARLRSGTESRIKLKRS